MLLFFSILLVLSDRMKKKATEPSSVSSDPTGEISYNLNDPYADEDIDPVIYFGGKGYVRKKKVDTYLFMGVDSYGEAEAKDGFSNNDQVDVLMLVVVDHSNKTYRVLSINRDSMTEIVKIGSTGDRAGTEIAQIALSHTEGSGLNDSCELTTEAVSNLLMGEACEHYISLKLDSIAIINSSVGGVDVQIPVDMTSVDPEMTKGANLKLTDKQAEYFVRSRKALEDDYNSTRMTRQTTYLNAWKTKAKAMMAVDPGFALNLIGDLDPYMITDMDLSKLSELASYLADYTQISSITIEGEYRQGKDFREFYCDDASLKQAILDLYYDEKA